MRFADLADDDQYGETDFRRREVVLDRTLSQVERRCTLTHELEHIHRGPLSDDDHLAAREEAIVDELAARRLVTLNLSPDRETAGLSTADHLAALHWYLPDLRVDTVLADAKWVGEPEPVRAAAQALGAELVLVPVAVADGSPRHDPESLGAALVPVLGATR